MRNFFLVLALANLTIGSYAGGKPSFKSFATCKGDSPCNACKNCKYCKRCAKDGLTCGICKK